MAAPPHSRPPYSRRWRLFRSSALACLAGAGCLVLGPAVPLAAQSLSTASASPSPDPSWGGASGRPAAAAAECMAGRDSGCVQITRVGELAGPPGAPRSSAATAAPAAGASRGNAAVAAPLCTGSGTDGYRVQAILAYDPAGDGPTTAKLDEIRSAISNADGAISLSAAVTGGRRHPRFVTDSGSPGCQVRIDAVAVGSGLASFIELRNDLIARGAASFSATENNQRKYLIWTEGDLEPTVPSACGEGLRFGDDRAGSLDNANVWTSFAAVKKPCWDTDPGSVGGSVPAHELMHMLGAVQETAPHSANLGHCNDEWDLMCYGPGMTYPCPNQADNQLLDCNHDDYFHTNPPAGSYLCRAWDSARSPYLEGWDDGLAPIGALGGLSATGVPGGIQVSWSPPAGCPGPSFYGVGVDGQGLMPVPADQTQIFLPMPTGVWTVTAGAWRDQGGPLSHVTVMVPNSLPSGDIVLSVTRGRDYGLLTYAFDPDGDVPTRMRVTVGGVSVKEYDWNYWWADMPKFTGRDHHESLVFLAHLPRGERDVCVDARDVQTGEWARVGCRHVSVK